VASWLEALKFESDDPHKSELPAHVELEADADAMVPIAPRGMQNDADSGALIGLRWRDLP
jgi:hypothetical protein